MSKYFTIYKSTFLLEQFFIAKKLIRYTFLIMPIAIVTGLVVALFLWLLDMATQLRWQNLWLIYFLPLAGSCITWLYKISGKNVEAGNNLIIAEIHQEGKGVPARMIPLILGSTIITHLFGGSAGREGTAVQMGGSIAAQFSRLLKLSHQDTRILLMAGISAGFGAVFGTPVAGAIFALEVLTIGRIKYDALLPCLLAGIIADITCSACGIYHTKYAINYHETKTLFSFINLDIFLLIKVIISGILFGLTSLLFSKTAHFIKEKSNKFIRNPYLISVVGAILVLVISYLLGTYDYLGLGVTNPKNGISIVSAFSAGGATYFSWFWKLVLTTITLSMGFKGGEVTPLFFIGASLGNTLATLSGSPIDLFAGLGFIAVFAGATNTPLACTLMGVELFGSENLMYYAIVCFTAYYFSGNLGIYQAQKRDISKY